jgi:RNA polymerase sigma-70 factor (ECF subfamily)
MPSRVIDSEEPDGDLLARFRAGDRESFAILVKRYQKPVYNAAFRVLGRAQEASDVCQQVFLRIVERQDDYDPRYKFFSWMYRIAVNEAIDAARRLRHEEPFEDDGDRDRGADDNDPERRYESGQAGQRVQAALMALSVDHRAVLVLRHYSECSYDEIGRILAIDDRTVKSRLYEARQRLAQELQDMRGVVR